jgi:hypothetical protein
MEELNRLVKYGVTTEAEYFRIFAGILSHPVDLEIDKLLSSLKIFDSLTECKVIKTISHSHSQTIS